MQFDSKLLPVLREGVNVIKMIFYKELKSYLSKKYDKKRPGFSVKLSGAILNELFGTPNTKEPFASFNRENRILIDKEMGKISEKFKDLRIPLTDALRIQFLCDSQEGTENDSILINAKNLDILLVDRQVPLPRTFMELSRKLGVSHNILNPDALKIGSEEQKT